MAVRVKDVIRVIEEWAPLALAEEWDAVGLQIGGENQRVHRLLVDLDVDEETVKTARKEKADLIFTHHPFLMEPLKEIRTDRKKGEWIKNLLCEGIALYAAHTNLDKARGGVNDVLAEKLGLLDIGPLTEEGLGRLGSLEKPQGFDSFAAHVASVLSIHHLRAGGHPEPLVEKVAVCGGSGADLIEASAQAKAEVLVTGDVGYHDMQRAKHCGIAVLDAGHEATERPIVEAACIYLHRIFEQKGWPIQVMAAKRKESLVQCYVRRDGQ